MSARWALACLLIACLHASVHALSRAHEHNNEDLRPAGLSGGSLLESSSALDRMYGVERSLPALASLLETSAASREDASQELQSVTMVDSLDGTANPQQHKESASGQLQVLFKPETTIVDSLPPPEEANSPATDSTDSYLPRFIERLRQPAGAHLYRNNLITDEEQQEEMAYQEQLKNLSTKAKRVFEAQLSQVQKCHNVLFNFTVPVVHNRDFFPKQDGAEQRFRFNCMERKAPNGSAEAAFLSSYNIDGFYVPEWVAFKIERPVFGYSLTPNTDKKSCAQRGFPAEYFSVKSNDISTPDKTFLLHTNAQLKQSGVSHWQNLRALQFSLPTHYLDCGGKHSTYALTNIVPANKYMFENNWARGDKGLREYVAGEVKRPPKGAEDAALEFTNLYHPLFAVGGVHYSNPKLEKMSWAYMGEDVRDPAKTKSIPIPQGIWQAVLDTRMLTAKKPELAAMAWYCDNSFKGPWPKVEGDNMYANGPKLCKVMSLSKLRQLVGVSPFPDLPLAALEARPLAAQWFLTDEF